MLNGPDVNLAILSFGPGEPRSLWGPLTWASQGLGPYSFAPWTGLPPPCHFLHGGIAGGSTGTLSGQGWLWGSQESCSHIQTAKGSLLLALGGNWKLHLWTLLDTQWKAISGHSTLRNCKPLASPGAKRRSLFSAWRREACCGLNVCAPPPRVPAVEPQPECGGRGGEDFGHDAVKAGLVRRLLQETREDLALTTENLQEGLSPGARQKTPSGSTRARPRERISLNDSKPHRSSRPTGPSVAAPHRLPSEATPMGHHLQRAALDLEVEGTLRGLCKEAGL
ncbi:uncharacterized protein LOC119231608 [Talpa occidentalis]|uniref:uncharacterized protein LOC119231608 n=1 Tax=Talpa occidentalis TaxID=50954 RepID=UPI0023F7A6BD|nr:uncharacterized protein LOC119231608 [Talpa occidentalis]